VSGGGIKAIAAIRAATSILMGGDSARSTDRSIILTAEKKVFLNGDYLFGVAWAPRVAEIVRHEFRPPTKTVGTTWTAFTVRTVLPHLKTALGPKAALKKSEILIGTKGGGIFEVDRDWIAKQSPDPFAAIGSGADYALGSLHSRRGDPRRRLLKAPKAAAHLNAYVRVPLTISKLPKEGLVEELWGSVTELPDRSAMFEVDPEDR